jgi:chorismate-pyruvate lyase
VAELRGLFGLFPAPTAEEMPEYEFVAADEVPPPYRDLLVHEHHMTVTVEEYHHDRVDVRVLARHQDGQSYARKILLTRHRDGRPVQFGIMRIWWQYCSAPVRQEITAEKTPLGRILIEHDVLRRIEPKAYLRVLPGAGMMEWFKLDRPRMTYGRLAVIHTNGSPAIDLVEIVAPAS